MRDQVELSFYVGYTGEAHLGFVSACVDTATKWCGGCYLVDGTGFWREGADRRSGWFDGPLKQEYTLCLKLTTEIHKEAQVMTAMRDTIANSAVVFGLDDAIRWVHVQRHLITGLHFSIEEELRDAA